ncbi:unnamed protein product, partial [Hapterophycus canaliculatus]
WVWSIPWSVFLTTSLLEVGVERNHFVSQLRVRGRWHKYDCLAGGPVVSSDHYDNACHASSRY